MPTPLTPSQRDRASWVLTLTTGLVTATTVAATGVATTLVARATENAKTAKATGAGALAAAQSGTAQAAAAAPRPRPTRTVVSTTTLARTTARSSARVGNGAASVRTIRTGGTARVSTGSTAARRVTSPRVSPAPRQQPRTTTPSTGS